MKKSIFTSCSLLITLSLFSQSELLWQKEEAKNVSQINYQYSISVLDEPYIDLTNSILISEGLIWHEPTWIVPIGFNFNMFGISGGFLTFDIPQAYGAVVGIYNIVSMNDQSVIVPFYANLLDRGDVQSGGSIGQSPISYKLDGIAPFRVFKLEWNNCGSYYELQNYNTMNDFVNFQLWLYETGVIEFRYGPQSMNNPGTWYEGQSGVYIGFLKYNWYTYDVAYPHSLVGSPSNPYFTFSGRLSGHPGEGFVYRFEPLNIGLEDEVKSNLALYPNPTKDALYISGGDMFAPVTILDMSGRVITEGNLENGKIYLGTLSAGVYFIQVENEVLKFVKH